MRQALHPLLIYIADMDFAAAFDWLVLSWVWQVLKKLGVSDSVIHRVKSLYEDSITITVVNNQLGRVFQALLDRVAVPLWNGSHLELIPCLGTWRKDFRVSSYLLSLSLVQLHILCPHLRNVMAYCDDVKPGICSMAEFTTVDKACYLFEQSSGCQLHRDPALGKCKFMKLGRSRGTLNQEDIPLRYLVLSDSLEMVGVESYTSFAKFQFLENKLH